MTTDDTAAVWANRALVSAAAIFLYDFALTFTNEIELYRHSGRDRKLLWSFVALRYFPAMYQFLMLLAIIFFDNPTCSALDKAAMALDTSFQLSYIGIISWRVKVINGSLVAIPLALLGLASPIINLACRLLEMTPSVRIINILPCLRAAFDAATTLALFWKLWRHVASMGALPRIPCLSSSQKIPSVSLTAVVPLISLTHCLRLQARNHGRNFVVPFVDSITAVLATRFMLELEERSRTHGRSRSRATSGAGPRLPMTTTDPTLVASEAPAPKCEERYDSDSASSLNTFGTRSIGWNRIGSCLGARSF
ncbi:hypothetical protein K438DRAFT_1832597 [Mycena galopus ATCC 62051]|nr:hypothetical protein K438DRAFT_1832597 [Mycena galopus ATCC 62051]